MFYVYLLRIKVLTWELVYLLNYLLSSSRSIYFEHRQFRRGEYSQWSVANSERIGRNFFLSTFVVQSELA